MSDHHTPDSQSPAHPSAPESLPRREFLRRSVAAAGATATAGLIGGPIVAGTTADRAQKVLGANDRIRIGVIGCGSLGSAHHIPTLMRMSQDKSVNIEVTAVCDIYEPRKLKAREATGGKLFHDYREMLDGDVVDGVVVVTPDHWHARIAIDAMEAGKDVHVEKPMTLYWEEARELYRTSQRLKRVVQVGAEGTSRDCYWQARKLIDAGTIGKLVWATGGVYRNDPSGDWNWPMDPDCSPKNLDWKAFLGSAPQRPFEPERYFRYRKYWDYSGGLAHDLIAHILSALQTCIGPEFPTRVSAAGGQYVHMDRDTPDTFTMSVEYPSKYTCSLFCTQNTEQGVEFRIRGNKASLSFQSGESYAPTQVKVTPEDAYKDQVEGRVIDEEPRQDHDLNFIDCMRTRKKTHCDPLTGYKVMVALGLAVRSYREGKMFHFDPEREEIVDPPKEMR